MLSEINKMQCNDNDSICIWDTSEMLEVLGGREEIKRMKTTVPGFDSEEYATQRVKAWESGDITINKRCKVSTSEDEVDDELQ